MKSFSSAYSGTPENDFTKSKQRQGKLDVSLPFLCKFIRIFRNKTSYNFPFLSFLLAVEPVFRQSEKVCIKAHLL